MYINLPPGFDAVTFLGVLGFCAIPFIVPAVAFMVFRMIKRALQ